MADNDKASRPNAFLSWLKGEDITNGIQTSEGHTPQQGNAPAPQAPAPAAQAAEPHPVLVAALAAGLDTPEKLTAVITESKARQDADKASAEQAVTTAREAATSAAVSAFGQGTPQLKAAQEAIAAQETVAGLASMAAGFRLVRPAGMQPGTGRQTKAQQAVLSEDAPGTTNEATAEALNPASVYAKRRGGK